MYHNSDMKEKKIISNMAFRKLQTSVLISIYKRLVSKTGEKQDLFISISLKITTNGVVFYKNQHLAV